MFCTVRYPRDRDTVAKKHSIHLAALKIRKKLIKIKKKGNFNLGSLKDVIFLRRILNQINDHVTTRSKINLILLSAKHALFEKKIATLLETEINFN